MLWKAVSILSIFLLLSGTSVADSREVEEVEIDPGLLPNPVVKSNQTQSRGIVTGKQFSTVPGQNSFVPGQTNFIPGQNSFLPGSTNFPTTAGGSFLPGQENFLPGQTPVGGFGTPGFGIGSAGQLPGTFPPGQQPPNQIPLPPGSILQDSVAFSAVRASDFTRNAVSQVRFDNTLTDIGYGWYPDRSEFICFYPGIYFFSFSALSPQTRQFKLSLVRNNQEVVSAWGDANGYNTGSNSAILQLQQNDRIYLVLQEGSIHESNLYGRGYTTFSGFRIR